MYETSRVNVEVETRSTFTFTNHYRNWGLFAYNLPGRYHIWIGKRPYSFREDLPETLGKTTGQE